MSGAGTFNNTATFNKQTNTTTTIGSLFNNTGTVNVNAGTLLQGGGGTSSGIFNIANGATLEYRNGSHTLNNITTSGAGTFAVTTENVGADAIVTLNGGTHTSQFLFSGSTLTGTDQVFQGKATWTGGTLTGAASTTFDNDVTISGANTKALSLGRVVNLNGTTTWTGNTAANNNAIQFHNGATINNNATFNDANPFASFIEHSTGSPHNFNNIGVYNKLSNTITTVDFGVAFNNTGTVNINAGTLRPSGGGTSTGVFNIAAGATLQFIDGPSTLNNATTQGAGTFMITTDNVGGDTVVTVNGGTHTTPFVLSGSTLAGGDHTFQGVATWSGGAINGAASTTFANDVTITGVNTKSIVDGRIVNLNAHDQLDRQHRRQQQRDPVLERRRRSTTTAPSTTQRVRVVPRAQRRQPAQLQQRRHLQQAVQHGHDGRPGRRLQQLGHASTSTPGRCASSPARRARPARSASPAARPSSTTRSARSARLNTAGTTALATRNLTVFGDYDNANFGVGNAFNARANVTGTGQIVAAGTPGTAQVLNGVGLPAGTSLTGGTTATPVLTIGNVRVGDNLVGYQIANNNTGGPALRGAIQTNVGGANITDPRLSGSGVTAANFGPIAAGGNAGLQRQLQRGVGRRPRAADRAGGAHRQQLRQRRRAEHEHRARRRRCRLPARGRPAQHAEPELRHGAGRAVGVEPAQRQQRRHRPGRLRRGPERALRREQRHRRQPDLGQRQLRQPRRRCDQHECAAGRRQHRAPPVS